MKLYFMPGACSLAAHISLREAGLPFGLVRYDKETHVLDSGQRLDDVNEKGYVPVLELDNGERLTEVPAVLQYIADLRPASGLAPPSGTWERYKLQEWLNFLSSTVVATPSARIRRSGCGSASVGWNARLAPRPFSCRTPSR